MLSLFPSAVSSNSVPRWIDRYGVPAAFAVCTLSSTAMLILRPIPNGFSYNLALEVMPYLFLAWVYVRYLYRYIDTVYILAPVLILGLVRIVQFPYNHNPGAEIVFVYRDVLDALSRGVNPYDCTCIVHFDSQGLHKYGNFNYPPAEIWPYWLASKLTRTWNSFVLVGTYLVLHLGACLVVWRTFPKERLRIVLAFLPLIMFYELHTNVAQTLLIVALLILVLQRQAQLPRPWQRPAIWFLFGIGLVAKFLVLPIFATYIWTRIDFKNPKKNVDLAVDTLAPVLVAVLCMAPFGVMTVLRETVLFNLQLETRAELTTFYPNVLSGMTTWLGVPKAYPILAVVCLAGAVLASRWLRLYAGMLCSCIVFLLVSPTPEPQYIPVIVLLSLAAILDKRSHESFIQGQAT